MVLRSKNSLMWIFLHRSLKKKTYGEKLYVEQKTENGFIIAIYAMNQKNTRVDVNKDKAFKVFIDYDVHKGRKKPCTTKEYTKSRLTFFNSILKCRCIPDGKFENLTEQQFIEHGIQRREHYRYFMFSCHKKIKPQWRIGPHRDETIDDDDDDDNDDCDEEMETSQSAPVSPLEVRNYSIKSKVNNNGETVFRLNFKLAEAKPFAKKHARSVDCLQQICEDIGITISDSSPDGENDSEEFKAVISSSNLPGCSNSPEIKIKEDINNNMDPSYQKEEVAYSDQSYNNAQILLNEMGLIARKLASITTPVVHASQESPVDKIFVDDLFCGQMPKCNPNSFLNLETEKGTNKNNLYKDLPNNASQESPVDKIFVDGLFCGQMQKCDPNSFLNLETEKGTNKNNLYEDLPNNASQESPVDKIFVDGLFCGQMQKCDPNSFLNLETEKGTNKNNLYEDLPNNASQESPVDKIFVDGLFCGQMQKCDPNSFLNLETEKGTNKNNLYEDLPNNASQESPVDKIFVDGLFCGQMQKCDPNSFLNLETEKGTNNINLYEDLPKDKDISVDCFDNFTSLGSYANYNLDNLMLEDIDMEIPRMN